MSRSLAKDVLIVDDDDSIRQMLAAALRRFQLRCATAADGIHALEELERSSYAVLLLDLMMPRLDGSGVIEKLREWDLPEHERPLIVVLTAATDHSRIVRSGDLVHAIIRKPFDLLELCSIVRECVRERARQSGRGGSSTPPPLREVPSPR